MRKYDTIATVFLILAITIPTVLFIIYRHFSNVSSSIIEIRIGIIAVIITITIFLTERITDSYKITKEEIERNNNACSAILNEISILENRFVLNNENRDSPVSYNRYIENLWDTSAYDSIVNSGLFTHFKTDTQTYLSNFYSKIKSRNNLLIYLDKFVDTSVSYPYYPGKENMIGDRECFYHAELTILDKDIHRLLDVVKDLICKELLS